MAQEVEERLQANRGKLTASERRLAGWFLAHRADLPFETAASIAAAEKVSAMTVARFVRKLGYADLRAVKDELRKRLGEFGGPQTPSSRTTFAPTSLTARTAGLEQVYALERTPAWSRIVQALAHSPRVHVASFGIGRFMGIGFSASLQDLRPKVAFADASDAYAEVLLDPAGALMVLIELPRYSPTFQLLAREAAARKIPTVILTDASCDWALDLTDDVLMIESQFGVGSLMTAQLLFELLLGAVAAELGPAADARFEAVHALRTKFAPAAAKR